ncbi:MAG: hypothetical protein ACYC1L_18010 [Alphaproteobacteria bacterium]
MPAVGRHWTPDQVRGDKRKSKVASGPRPVQERGGDVFRTALAASGSAAEVLSSTGNDDLSDLEWLLSPAKLAVVAGIIRHPYS